VGLLYYLLPILSVIYTSGMLNLSKYGLKILNNMKLVCSVNKHDN